MFSLKIPYYKKGKINYKIKKNLFVAIPFADFATHICKRSNLVVRMEYKKSERKIPVCLECGDKIKYGRVDKKFCCDKCRNRYNNELAKSGRALKRKVLKHLSRNYEILDNVFRAGYESVDLVELVAKGFNPGIVTSCSKVKGHNEYGCFDIKYIMTATRIYSVVKIQNI